MTRVRTVALLATIACGLVILMHPGADLGVSAQADIDDAQARAVSHWDPDLRDATARTGRGVGVVDCDKGEVSTTREHVEYRVESREEGCLEVSFAIEPLVLDSTGGTVRFTLLATSESATAPPEEIGLESSFTAIYDGQDRVTRPFTQTVRSGEPRSFSAELPEAARGTRIDVRWDIATGPVGEGSVSSGVDIGTFVIRLQHVQIVLGPFDLPTVDRALAGGPREGETEMRLRSIDTDLPAFLWRGGDAQVDVSMSWPSGRLVHFATTELDGVVHGALVDEETRVAQLDDQRSPWLGPGRLSLVYAVEAPLGRSGVASAAVLLLVGAMVGTAVGSGRHVLATSLPSTRFRTVWATIGLTATILVAWLLVSGMWSLLRLWPPVPEAVGVLGGLTAFTFGFAGLWLHAARRRARDLMAARAGDARVHSKLEARQSELEALLYGTSHDMQTPVLALRLMLDELRSDLTSGQRADVDVTLEQMKGSLQGVDEMVGGLLEYARAGAEDDTEVTDLADLTKRLFDEARLQEGRPEAHIVMTGRPGPVAVDRMRIRQILQNLLTNAVRYGREPAPRVRIGLETTEEGLRICVEDDGDGIPVERRDEVFVLFKRGPGASGRRGSGIGLATVRRAVESLGGDIRIGTSGLGGASFVVDLPSLRPDAAMDE